MNEHYKKLNKLQSYEIRSMIVNNLLDEETVEVANKILLERIRNSDDNISANSESERLGFANYLSDHWRGNLPLILSFWVNYVLLPVLMSFPVQLLSSNITKGIFLLLIWVPFAIWSLVGVWRSASSHRNLLMAYVVKAIVILGVFGIVIEAFRISIEAFSK